MIGLVVVSAALAVVAILTLIRPARVRAFLTRGAPQLLDIEGRPYHHGLRGLAWLALAGAATGLVGTLWHDREHAGALAAWTAMVLLVVLGVWFVAAIAWRADRQARVLAARRDALDPDEPVSIEWIRAAPRGPGYGGDIGLLAVTLIGIGIAAAQLEALGATLP